MERDSQRNRRAREIVAKRFRLFIHELMTQFTRKSEDLWQEAEERSRRERQDLRQ